MNIDKGLSMDINPRDAENLTWKYSKNIILSKGLGSIENEGGFSLIDYTPNNEIYLGHINVPDTPIFFTERVINDIRYFNIYKIVSNVVILVKSYSSSTDEYNIPYGIYTDAYITGVYNYNIKNELIIIWTISPNNISNLPVDEIRILNTVNPTNNFQYTLFNPYIYNNGIINASITSGKLISGTYYITYNFVDDLSELSYTIISTKMIVGSEVIYHDDFDVEPEFRFRVLKGTPINEPTNQGILININTNQTQYDKIQIGVIHDNGINKTAYKTSTLKLINGNSIYHLNSLSSLIPISEQDIVIHKNPYDYSPHLAIDRNKLLLGGVMQNNYLDFTWEDGQNLANNVFIQFNIVNVNSVQGTYNAPTFVPDEVYAFYLILYDLKGRTIGTWHIPHKATFYYNGTLNFSNSLAHINQDEYYPQKYHVTGPIGKVRHHKINVGNPVNIIDDNNVRIVANVYLSHNIRYETIGAWAIGYAKRTHTNSRVIASDILTHGNFAYPSQFVLNFSGEKYYARGHSYEMMVYKPLLSFINDIQVLKRYAIAKSPNNQNRYLIEIHSAYQTYTESEPELNIRSLQYIPNDSSVDSNNFGESFISVKSNIYIDFSDDYEYIKRIYYLNSSPNYYTDFQNQDVIISNHGSFTLAENQTAVLEMLCLGDAYINAYTVRQTATNVWESSEHWDALSRVRVLVYNELSSIPIIRHEGTNEFEKIYPFSPLNSIYDYDKTKDNFIDTATGTSFNRGYNSINEYYKDNITIDYERLSQMNIIAISDVYNLEYKNFNWRTFKPNNYFITSLLYGVITNLLSDGINLYIQQMNELFIASVKDVLLSNNEGATYIGTGDLFDREPRPLVLSEEGHISCISKLHSTITPFGYLVADVKNKRVILVSDLKPIEISNLGAEVYFKDTLNNSVKVGYDYLNKRIFIHNVQDKTSMSFHILKSRWISNHDYAIDFAFTNRNTVFYVIDNKIAKFTDSNNFGRYGDYIRNNIDSNIKRSFIDIYYTDKVLSQKLLQSLVWKTLIQDNNVMEYNNTIDAIMIYNDTQCTGEINVNIDVEYFDTRFGKMTADKWYFNQINDAVLNDALPIFNPDLSLNTSNVNMELKDWFNSSKFICDWAVIRLIVNNNLQRKILINFVDLITSMDYR